MNPNDLALPADLHEMSLRLDRAAAADRASAPADLEARVIAGSSPSLRAEPALRLVGAGPTSSRGILARLGGLRMAAAVAVVGAVVGAMAMLRTSANGGASIDVDSLLDSASAFDSLSHEEQLAKLEDEWESINSDFMSDGLIPEIDSRDSSL